MNSNGLLRVLEKYFVLDDPEFCEVIWAVFVSNAMPGERVWLRAMGPPSTTKSTVLRAFEGTKHVVFRDSLTEHTLISGFRGGRSLLNELDGKVLIIPDSSHFESLPAQKRAQILAQLRGVYDGKWACGFGSDVGVVAGKGEFGVILGCTPKSDEDTIFETGAGGRFFNVRLKGGLRKDKARRALDLSGQEREIAKQIGQATRALVKEHWNKIRPSSIDQEAKAALVDLADVVTRARTPVPRDGRTREVLRLPLPEEPPRFVKQSLKVAEALAKIRGRSCVGEAEIQTTKRVALDCVPPERLMVMELMAWDSPISAKVVSTKTGLPRTVVRRVLEDLELLKVVEDQSSPSLKKVQHKYVLADDAQAVLNERTLRGVVALAEDRLVQ